MMTVASSGAATRRASPPSRPFAWVGILSLTAFVLRLPVFIVPFSSGDEATYTALAHALLDGRAMYAGAVDHKPPLTVITYAATYMIAGLGAIHWVHALSVLVVAFTGALLSRVARRLGLAESDARAAGLAWVVFSSIGPAGDALAANGEIFMLLPSVAAVALVARSSSGEEAGPVAPGRWLGAGVMAGIATLYKYQAATIILPLALLAAWQAPRGRAVTRLALIGIGCCFPIAALIGWYHHIGHLDALQRWAWAYPLVYAGSLPAAEVLRNLFTGLLSWNACTVGLLIAAARAFRTAWPGPSSRRAVVTLAWLAGGAIAVSAGGRFTLHYFLQVLPPLCLLAAPAFSEVAARPGPWRRGLLVATAVPFAVFFLSNALGQPLRPSLGSHTRVYREVGRYLDAHAAPTDSMFVWGNSPEIYFFSRRVMGTRFPFCNYHSGKIWGTAADREGAVVPPGQVYEPAWQMLLNDIEGSKPRWIVDAAAGRLDRWAGHDITRYPRLSSVIDRAYRRHATVAGVVIYRREAGPPATGRREDIDPDYTIVLRPRALVSLDAADDRFDLDVLPRRRMPSVRAYHVSLTIRSGAATVTSLTSVHPAAAAGGASCAIAPVVPPWEAIKRGTLRSFVPAWRYGGFTLEAEVRENSEDGRVVYRLRQEDAVIGISWAGFLDRIWFPMVLAGAAIAGLVLMIDRRRAGGRLLRFELTALVLLAASASFSRWAVLLLAPLTLLWLALPPAIRVRIVTAIPSPRLRPAGNTRWPVAAWSPSIMCVALTAWLLFWHQSLIAVHGFSLGDFSAHLRGLGALYLAMAMVFSSLIHAALWRSQPGRARNAVVAAGLVVLAVSAVARALDWGTFYYSAGHVDDDFWTNLFYAQNLGFASRGATWWPLIGLIVSLAAFVALFRIAGRFAQLSRQWAGESPRQTPGSLLVANALAAYLAVAFVHATWTLAAATPLRDVSPSVREAFSGIPEYKVLEPLARRALARPPERPQLDAAFVEKLGRAGLRLNTLTPEFPLMKSSIYLDQAGGPGDAPRVPGGTNLVVILAESLSAALINDRVHGVEGLTPNFSDFARHAFVFRNLYSSDFPTIKGQLATLASFAFDHRGLPTTSESGNPLKARYLFLSDILRGRGYATVHLQADFGSFASTKAIFARHQYDRIISAEDRELSAGVARPQTKTWGVHDEDLFGALNTMLASGGLREPFLVTVSTTDMHFPYTVTVRHPGASGNDLLDSVHTEDRAFGVFWKAFQRSRWADNTMVLLTADHALVRQAVRRGGTDPRVSAFDYVTGMLYIPGGGPWAGRGTDIVCTQLDLLPTILDVMAVDLPNPFLGLSIFSERSRYPLALGRDIPLDRLSPAARSAADAIGWTDDDQSRYMRFLRYLAAANRITP